MVQPPAAAGSTATEDREEGAPLSPRVVVVAGKTVAGARTDRPHTPRSAGHHKIRYEYDAAPAQVPPNAVPRRPAHGRLIERAFVVKPSPLREAPVVPQAPSPTHVPPPAVVVATGSASRRRREGDAADPPGHGLWPGQGQTRLVQHD